MNDTTYDEKWSFRLSSLNLFTLVSLYSIILIIGVFLVIRFTPLKGLFATSTTDHETISQIEENSENLDSLHSWTEANELYLNNLMRILNDEPFDDSLYNPDDSIFENYQPDFSKSSEDSLLRLKIENSSSDPGADESVMGIFFAPVKGTVSRSFNPSKNHMGVDVVTQKDEAIKACLNGTVVFSGWSPDEGNLIIIQHNENLISIYKHCSVLLKESGDTVREGDPIGIVGNSGETSTGPHLHFELWQRGLALNPQEFISFK